MTDMKTKLAALQARCADVTEACRVAGRDYAVEVGMDDRHDEGEFWISELVTTADPPVHVSRYADIADLENRVNGIAMPGETMEAE